MLWLWEPETLRRIKTSQGGGDRKSRRQTDSGEKATETKWSQVCRRLRACNEVCVYILGRKTNSFLYSGSKLSPLILLLVSLPSLLLSGPFRCHGDWRGAAAPQASARFVRSCVQVNTFCSRPSVHAQICMRVGRLGWKRSRRRQREREERSDERKPETKEEERTVIFFFWVCRYQKYRTICYQMVFLNIICI